MRFPRMRFTVRTMMMAVVMAAVTLTVETLVPRAADPLLFGDRFLGIGAAGYVALIGAVTGIVAAPFAFAVGVALRPLPKDRVGRRLIVRGFVSVLAVAAGLAVLRC